MIVIICLVAIIVISSYNLGWISLPGRAVQSGAAVAEEPLTDASSGIKDGITGIFGFRSLQKENYELKKKVEDLQNQLTEAQLTEQKLQQLRNCPRVSIMRTMTIIMESDSGRHRHRRLESFQCLHRKRRQRRRCHRGGASW